MEGNEIEKASERNTDRYIPYKEVPKEKTQQALRNMLREANKTIQQLQSELTRTNAQLDEMVTKYNELSKKYADLYSKYYGK